MTSKKWYDGENDRLNGTVGMYIEIVAKNWDLHQRFNGIYEFLDFDEMVNIKSNQTEHVFCEWGGKKYFNWRYVTELEATIHRLVTM